MSIMCIARTQLSSEKKQLFSRICDYLQQNKQCVVYAHIANSTDEFVYKKSHLMAWSSWPKLVTAIILFIPLLIRETIRMGWWRVRLRIQTIILFTTEDQLLLTLPAKLFGIKLFWYQPIAPPSILSWWWNICSYGATSIYTSSSISQLPPFSTKKPHAILPLPLISSAQSPANIPTSFSQHQKFIIGMAGDLGPESGLEYAIKAMPIILEVIPYTQLIVAGEGKEKKKLLWLIDQLGLKDQIQIVPQGNQRSNWMRHFTVFLFLPQHNRVSMQPLLEAMSAGCPIVSANIDIIKEILTPSKHGILIEPRNSEMIAQAIINFANHPDWRVTMGELCRRNIQEKHSMERFLQVLDQTLSQ